MAWAASCVDGVVVASDAMWVTEDAPTKMFHAFLTDQKLGWVGDRVAYVISGSFDRRGPYGSLLDESCELDALSSQLFRELGERRRPPTATSVSDRRAQRMEEFELLMAGGPVGSTPEVLWLQSDPQREPITRLRRGSTIAGACLGFDESMPTQHRGEELTTDEAIVLCVNECFDYVRRLYRQVGYDRLSDFPGVRAGRGAVPPVAFPLQIAVITPDDVRRYEVFSAEDDPKSPAAGPINIVALSARPEPWVLQLA